MLEETELICQKKKDEAEKYLEKIKNQKTNKSIVPNKNLKSKSNYSKKVKLEKMKKEL